MEGSPLEREPCPDRILDDLGGAFAMGAVGGSAYHFLKGLRHAPRGTRIAGGMEAVRMNVPRVSGHFTVWAGLFSACDCAVVYARQKEDPWNSIIAGAAASGFLAMRRGFGAVGRSALVGGALFALLEGVGLMFRHVTAALHNPPLLPADDPNLAAAVAAGSGGFQGVAGFRGLPQSPMAPIEVAGSSSGGKSEILESFDTPSPPIPSFEYK